MKWTPDNDQILLLKILETCNVNADAKAIAASWPDGDEKPTARAITERIVKIRNTSKAKGGNGNFKVSNSKNQATAKSSHHKSGAKRSGTAKDNSMASFDGATEVNEKRKRTEDDSPDDTKHPDTKLRALLSSPDNTPITTIVKTASPIIQQTTPSPSPKVKTEPLVDDVELRDRYAKAKEWYATSQSGCENFQEAL